ncbi:MAG: hypothetical protein R3C11_04200 [Planctomycetaceae bacterium]
MFDAVFNVQLSSCQVSEVDFSLLGRPFEVVSLEVSSTSLRGATGTVCYFQHSCVLDLSGSELEAGSYDHFQHARKMFSLNLDHIPLSEKELEEIGKIKPLNH